MLGTDTVIMNTFRLREHTHHRVLKTVNAARQGTLSWYGEQGTTATSILKVCTLSSILMEQ
jgi:hypothetical protein